MANHWICDASHWIIHECNAHLHNMTGANPSIPLSLPPFPSLSPRPSLPPPHCRWLHPLSPLLPPPHPDTTASAIATATTAAIVFATSTITATATTTYNTIATFTIIADYSLVYCYCKYYCYYYVYYDCYCFCYQSSLFDETASSRSCSTRFLGVLESEYQLSTGQDLNHFIKHCELLNSVGVGVRVRITIRVCGPLNWIKIIL